MNFNPVIIHSGIFVLVFLSFLGSYTIIIQSAAGQMNMDSFSAKGIIFTQLTSSPLLKDQDQDLNKTESINTLLNNSMNSIQSNTNNALPVLSGQWAFDVNKGEADSFRAIFTLVQNEKLVNAFAIFNLKDTRYIQINDKGTEIISGTVDLTSIGLKNETLTNIPATITISGLTTLRISLDENIVGKFFKDTINGATRFFADGSGNILIGPRPPPPNSPQSNSFYDSNYLD
jgi:hypothetical protein